MGAGGGGRREKGAERVILVDPGLPPAAVVARLFERSGLSAQDVTDVFLTSFQPDTHRGIERIRGCVVDRRGREGSDPARPRVPNATSSATLMTARKPLLDAIEEDLAVLRRCRLVPDHRRGR